jgi:hypothetical protein
MEWNAVLGPDIDELVKRLPAPPTLAPDAGDAVRLPPEAERTIRNGDTESTFVLVGAP